MLTAVEDGPYVAASAPFDPHAVGQVLRIRGVRLATLGYLGHMWELYAMWTWIPAFAAASIAARGGSAPARMGSLVAFVAIASGAVGCVVAGRWADAWGKARVAGLADGRQRGVRRAQPALVFGGPLPWLFAARGRLGILRRRRLGAVLRAGLGIQPDDCMWGRR